jgi:Protein of unknown function (DUF2474)
MPQAQAPRGPRLWGRRLAWLVAIWAISVGALALVALLLKTIMKFVGMTG